MSDLSMRRVDELLTELVEHVETARTVPMSTSIVLPRERVLDLLDELREVLPPEIAEARRVMTIRDQILAEAHADATVARDAATSASELIMADGRSRADQLVRDAEVHAYEIVEASKAERAQLVSATGVHQAASAAAEQLRSEAEQFRIETLDAAQRYSMDIRDQADRYASKLTADSEEYAERTLAELAETLHRAAATAEQGRITLAMRRAPQAGPDPLTDPLTDPLSGPLDEQPTVAVEVGEPWDPSALSA